MTLDEAIERFENNAEFERTHENLRGCQRFKQLAEWLKELKAYKEQEPCEDAISRKAVDTLVDELARAISDERDHISRGRSAGEIMQDILDLPSVTPKQKTGKWKVLGYDDPLVRLYKCPECHMKITLKFKYCPNCGTKMENQDE